jgi:hypothetical protein
MPSLLCVVVISLLSLLVLTIVKGNTLGDALEDASDDERAILLAILPLSTLLLIVVEEATDDEDGATTDVAQADTLIVVVGSTTFADDDFFFFFLDAADDNTGVIDGNEVATGTDGDDVAAVIVAAIDDYMTPNAARTD